MDRPSSSSWMRGSGRVQGDDTLHSVPRPSTATNRLSSSAGSMRFNSRENHFLFSKQQTRPLTATPQTSTSIRGRVCNPYQIFPPIQTQSKLEIQQELTALHTSVTNRPNSRHDSSRPKLPRSQSIARERVKEIESDFIEIQREKFLEKRRMYVPNFKLKDKLKLRKFFSTLDNDGSGEVSFKELFDPLVSSGMYHSSQEVVCLLSAIDGNESNGVDFSEFFQSIRNNKIGDQSKLKTLISCTSDPLGFEMDTLLCCERRKLLQEYIIGRGNAKYTTDDERKIADLICNENISALEVLIRIQKKKYGALSSGLSVNSASTVEGV